MMEYSKLDRNVPLSLTILAFIISLSSISRGASEFTDTMPASERAELKEEARDMFYHAYHAYMDNAYPADELMPLSCAGRWRGSEASRGDIDDTLGNFSLTLIDTLDTLVVLGDIEEFERAVKLVIKDVTFDSDIIVSVFETNIRVLGGLLSGHILAEYLQHKINALPWYRGELLSMAKDVGYRLLPAFNTTTGIPHARVNLKYGLKVRSLESSRETCTACAGTMILEMAALSRLSGEPIFEEKAHRAMDELWRLRHRSSDLMGTVLNVHSGDWVRRDSGVGAGIDSYYEYCLKAYILLGDDRYLGRFNKHYSAVMRYISQGPMLLDVHMHRPHTNSRNFMDALLAFWPGLQVLKGDIKPAVETHEMLYQVMQRHNFIPEAFTTDFQVHWGQHPLRPEFLESTYFLYRATGDPYYLEVGRNVLKSLQKFARVPCGYAAVKDVRTNIHEDRMDSFVLAETFKYLYLLFADPSDLLLDLDQFLFTTEAHLLPLTLARSGNYSLLNLGSSLDFDGVDSASEDSQSDARTCPNTQHLFPEKVRRPLRNMVDGVCPRKEFRRKLRAVDFQMGNVDHLKLLKDMGINIMAIEDGRVQLVHAFGNAASSHDAEEGLLFMQEMVELSKTYAPLMESQQQAVSFVGADGRRTVIQAGPAHFGRQLRFPADKVTARVSVATPLRGCQDLLNSDLLKGHAVILERGDCMFVEKARRIQKAGAVAGIVVDHTLGTSAATSPMFAMSGDGTDDVTIPMAFLFYEDALKLIEGVQHEPLMEITLSSVAALEEEAKKEKAKMNKIETNSKDSTLEKLKESIIQFLNSPSFRSQPEPPQPQLQPPQPQPPPSMRTVTATPILHPVKSLSSEGSGTITPLLSEPTGGSAHDVKISRLHKLLIRTMLQKVREEDSSLQDHPATALYSLLLNAGNLPANEHTVQQFAQALLQGDVNNDERDGHVALSEHLAKVEALLQGQDASDREKESSKESVQGVDANMEKNQFSDVKEDVRHAHVDMAKNEETFSQSEDSQQKLRIRDVKDEKEISAEGVAVVTFGKFVDPPLQRRSSETNEESLRRTNTDNRKLPDEL